MPVFDILEGGYDDVGAILAGFLDSVAIDRHFAQECLGTKIGPGESNVLGDLVRLNACYDFNIVAEALDAKSAQSFITKRCSTALGCFLVLL